MQERPTVSLVLREDHPGGVAWTTLLRKVRSEVALERGTT